MDRQKIITSILIIIETGVLCLVLVMGVLFNAANGDKKPSHDKQNEQTASGDNTKDTQQTEGSNTEADNTENDWATAEKREIFSDAVEQKLAEMTTEQKVAQLFLTSPEAITGVDRVTISGNGTRDALQKYPVAGLIYSQANFVGTEQATSLINGAQGYSQENSGLLLFVLIGEDAPNYAGFATISLTMQERDALVMELGDTPAIAAGIQTCTYTTGAEVVAAMNDGMNLIYAPTNFVEIYEAVLTAANDGTISQVRLENAVGKVLTEKMQ